MCELTCEEQREKEGNKGESTEDTAFYVVGEGEERNETKGVYVSFGYLINENLKPDVLSCIKLK